MGVLKPRTTNVVIYQGDDLEQLAELSRAVQRAEAAAKAAAKSPLRAGDEIPSAQSEKDAYDAFVDEAAERAVVVTLTAIGSTRWRGLLAEHPPRTHTVQGKEEPIEADTFYNVNTETFPLALLTYNRDGRRTVTVDPAIPETGLAEFFAEDCSEGDLERCWTTAYWLNRTEGVDPKDTKFSSGSPRSDEN